MGDIVNRTSEVAGEWQRHVVWVRMNVAFIRAELPDVSGAGHDVSDIEALVASFESVFEQFCRNEFGVFVAARAAETDDSQREALVTSLRRTRGSFRSWLRDYNGIVEKTKAEAAGRPAGLPLVLLLCCGGELLTGHNRFVDVIDAYLDEIRG
ncbi:hypothetical protein ACFL09_06780 [Planctomycetota bacterium]